ncbi:MAG: hypothetical protein M4579_000722 [Chaenotheca gracillima]|nr:MAG: hypothetical protein M4579_000722 [Chaenotheca gracillima]
MPTLKQLTCHLELGVSKSPLKEYSTSYADGYVQTYIAAPSNVAAVAVPTFNIHLTSKGYIAPGLAMFVFIDGVYQCNRNRFGLKMPGKAFLKSDTEINIRVRQKEERLRDGSWVGNEWKFKKMSVDSSESGCSSNHGNSTSNSKEFGKIEVVILRCQEHRMVVRPSPSVVSPQSVAEHSILKGTGTSVIGALFDGAGDDMTGSQHGLENRWDSREVGNVEVSDHNWDVVITRPGSGRHQQIGVSSEQKNNFSGGWTFGRTLGHAASNSRVESDRSFTQNEHSIQTHPPAPIITINVGAFPSTPKAGTGTRSVRSARSALSEMSGNAETKKRQDDFHHLQPSSERGNLREKSDSHVTKDLGGSNKDNTQGWGNIEQCLTHENDISLYPGTSSKAMDSDWHHGHSHHDNDQQQSNEQENYDPVEDNWAADGTNDDGDQLAGTHEWPDANVMTVGSSEQKNESWNSDGADQPKDNGNWENSGIGWGELKKDEIPSQEKDAHGKGASKDWNSSPTDNWNVQSQNSDHQSLKETDGAGQGWNQPNDQSWGVETLEKRFSNDFNIGESINDAPGNVAKSNSSFENGASRSDGVLTPLTSSAGSETPSVPQYWSQWDKSTHEWSTTTKQGRKRSDGVYSGRGRSVLQDVETQQAATCRVQVGRSAGYSHKLHRPDYLDTMQEPYASTLNVEIVEDPEEEKLRLNSLPKEQIIEEYMRVKAASVVDGNSSRSGTRSDHSKSGSQVCPSVPKGGQNGGSTWGCNNDFRSSTSAEKNKESSGWGENTQQEEAQRQTNDDAWGSWSGNNEGGDAEQATTGNDDWGGGGGGNVTSGW